MAIVLHHQIEAAEQEVEYLKATYLRRFGWNHTSTTPGSYWLWKRDFADVDAKGKAWHDAHPKASPHQPYGVITAGTDLAVSMTVRCLDEQPELEEAQEA